MQGPAAVLVLALLPVLQCRQYTLNVPRVLLPIVPSSGVKANFTLKSQHGCFTWKSTKPDIASVEPLYVNGEKQGSRCSREALLTPQSTELSRQSSVIIAEEQTTGQTLRCDIFVDTIHRVEITTRTRELLLEEEPERFEILGFDEEGNTFSTLRGHRFEWSLLRDEEATHQTVEPEAILHFVRFDDSSYETDPIIGSLEAAGLHGDTVLVEGVSTGTAKVQVKPVDRVWKSVSPAVVKLLVIENIMLQPAIDVYLLPLCSVDYAVERKKHGKTEVVAMPSDQYSLELTNTTVASLDVQRSRVTGLVIGDTEVVLQDKNMLHTPSATKPTAGVHVVPPHHLGYSILPDNVWVLEVGREYHITVHVFDKLNHPILVTKNVVLDTVLPSLYLHSLHSSSNGSFHIVRAEKKGKATIHSTLSKVKHPDTGQLHSVSPTVSRDQSLEIYDPIRVEPHVIVVLWDPTSEYRYQHQMKASGGSGGYLWSCDTDTVAHVTSTGLVTSVTEGKSLVIASDKRNAAHSDTAEVHVVPPSEMLFLPSRVEAAVGSSLSLPLQVTGMVSKGDKGQRSLEAFGDCRMMTVSISSSDTTVFNVSVDTSADLSSLPPNACLLLRALALKPGHTKLTIQYDHNTTHLETSVVIAAYPPLRATRPPNIAVLTIGSSFNFLFDGGPAPWVLDRSKYFQRLSPQSPLQLSVHDSPSSGPGQHVYRVLCRALGEQEIRLEVGNGPSLKNSQPARETVMTRVSCTLPVSMAITPVVDLMEECPLLQSSNQNVQIPVKTGQALDLRVRVFDAENREFDNCSSLWWTWGSSNQFLLRPPSQSALVHREEGGDFLTVVPSQQPGSVTMTANSESYQPSYLATEKIEVESAFSPGVNYSLSLLLRPPLLLTPSHVLVYNHHDNQVVIHLNNGSGHFQVASSSSSSSKQPVATTQYDEQLHRITISPLSDGELTITCRDVCLASASKVTAVVTVAGIHSLNVRVSDKVQVGTYIQAFVSVLDRRGLPFPADQHRYMNLRSNPKSHHIEIQGDVAMETIKSHDSELLQYSSVFNTYGAVVGHTHLMFNVTTPTGHVISSPPVPIQVFDALSLMPEYLILLPTATFQIHSSGGPMLEAAIKFSISNSTVAMVTEDTGLVEATHPGHATITGKAQAPDPVSGHMTTYSQDEVILTVLKLTGIRIAIATTRLLAGVELSVHAVGLNDESPFTFASALPGLSFQWSSTNMDVVSLTSVYDKAGVALQEEQDFAARLWTRNPGQSTVKLVATCHTGACEPEKQVFKDEVKIEVIPPLTLLHPLSGKLLIPQGGRAKILTSRDGLSSVTYALFGDSVRSEGDGVISVSEEGEVFAGGVNGHAVVMVTASEKDTGLNQTAMVHVEVATVASLSLSPLSVAHATPNSKHHAFPLGYSAEFLATLHDGVGRPFDYAEIDLTYRLNRFDIVRVTPGSNGTFILKAAAKGQVIVRVSLRHQPRVSDYVRVHVGYAIIPSLAVVHVGTKVCFTTHLTEDSAGEWTTSDRGVMQLLQGSGVGTAISPGRAVIYHKIKGVSDTHTEITVKRVEEVVINVNEKDLPLFTNAPRQEELGTYHIPVRFYHSLSSGAARGTFTALSVSPNPLCSEETGVKGGTFIQQVPFECLLDLRDNGSPLDSRRFITSQAHFDHKLGTSSCVFIPNNEHHAVEFLSTKDRLSLSVRVRAFDSVMSYDVTSSSVPIPFLPAFSVGRSNITLTPTDPSTTLSITGLPRQLQAIQISSPHPLSVTKHTSSDHLFTYLLSLTERHPEPFKDMEISFTSSLTHQVAIVHVSYSDANMKQVVTMETSACPATPTPPPPKEPDVEKPPIEATLEYLGENTTLTLVFLVTLLAVILGLVIVCKAFRDSSPKPSGGFSSYLPHSPAPQQAFSPPSASPPSFTMTPTGVQRTPPVPGSGGQSAFRRAGAQSFSPSAQSLYSQ